MQIEHFFDQRRIPRRIVGCGQKYNGRGAIQGLQKFLHGEGEIAPQGNLAEFHAAESGLESVDTKTGLKRQDMIPARLNRHPDEQIDDLIRTVPRHDPVLGNSMIGTQSPAQPRATRTRVTVHLR